MLLEVRTDIFYISLSIVYFVLSLGFLICIFCKSSFLNSMLIFKSDSQFSDLFKVSVTKFIGDYF